MRRLPLRACVAAGALLAVAGPARAGVGDLLAGAPDGLADAADATPEPAPRRRAEWFPHGLLYPLYLADLGEPRFAVRVASSPRWHRPRLQVLSGVKLALIRWHPNGTDSWGLEAQVYALQTLWFDLEHETDLLESSGRWGFPFAWRLGTLALKAEVGHFSSHKGDETIEHQKQQRINYLKEELVGGVHWDPFAWGRCYLEGAYAIRLGKEQGRMRQRPARVQAGAELRPFAAWPRAWPVFLAIDWQARQETGWNGSFHLEGGVVLWSDGTQRTLRLVAGWYRGKSPMSQYFRTQEQWWSFGVTAEL